MQHSNKLKIILKFKYLFLLVIILISIIRVNTNKTKIKQNETSFVGIVESYSYKKDYVSFIIKGKEKIKCNYYGNKKIKLSYGDKIYLTGTLYIPTNNTIPNTFNYKKYLKNNGIYYVMEVNQIEKIKKTSNLLYILKNIIYKRINKIDEKGYLNAFILGNKNDIDLDVYNDYYKNGITHLFSISGMHISLLASIILFILNKIKISKLNNIFILFFLILYMVLTNYQPSIVRSIVFYLLLNISNFKKILKSSDILLFSIIIILIVKPNYIYNIGFIYSSIISYSLLYFNSIFNKSYFKNLLLVSLTSFLFSLPITVNLNYKINILSIFINIIFVPLITFIIYPLSLLVLLFPFTYPILYKTIIILELISNITAKVTILNIVLPKLNSFFIIVYYLFLFLSFKKSRKIIFIIVTLLLITKFYNTFDNNYYLYFLNVGQGDMIVIKKNNNVILIDSGAPNFNSDYKKSSNYIKFLNGIGIDKVNYFVFTHGDYDHMGEAINLVENFKVEKVIFNCGEFNDLETDLINVLNKKKIPYYSCIKELNIDNSKLYFLQTKVYDNENDNSNVIYTDLNGYKFMFMGDASSTIEKEILKNYNISDIDVLKVGHHGSKTSSSREFINEVNPNYSIISVGKNNRYGHPNKEVLNNLANSKIYRTDEDGSIMFKIKNSELKIETCSP